MTISLSKPTGNLMMESYNDNLHKNANDTLYQYAKELRKNHTEAEDILWQHLRRRKLGGLKFRRQHPLHKYIADFYCNEKKLVIELDGDVHFANDNPDYDRGRTQTLEELGITVIRFSNDEILRNIQSVLAKVVQAANNIT
jgi:very-short-patch-repair endonuclease